MSDPQWSAEADDSSIQARELYFGLNRYETWNPVSEPSTMIPKKLRAHSDVVRTSVAIQSQTLQM